jgi:hypothetical protein
VIFFILKNIGFPPLTEIGVTVWILDLYFVYGPIILALIIIGFALSFFVGIVLIAVIRSLVKRFPNI